MYRLYYNIYINAIKLIGKTIADITGITEKLGGTKNISYNPVKLHPSENFEDLNNALQSCNTTVRIDTVLEEHGLQKVQNLSEHIKELYTNNKLNTLSSDNINEFINQHNYNNLAQTSKGITGISNAITEYNKNIAGSETNARKFSQALQSTNSNFAGYISGLNGGKASLAGYSAQLVAAKAKTFALQTATMAMNTVLSFGIGTAVSMAVNGIMYLVNYTKIQKENFENAKTTAEQYANAIRGLQEESTKTAKTAEDLKKRYAGLVQGVNPFTNENKNLSNKDYNEFLDLNQKLAEIFPGLTKKYDENGNAILGLSGGIDTVITKIQELIKQENLLKMAELDDSLKKYAEGDGDNKGQLSVIDGYAEKAEEAQEIYDIYNKFNDLFAGKNVGTDELGANEIEKVAEKAGLKFTDIDSSYGTWDLSTLSGINQKKLHEAFETFFKEVSEDRDKAKALLNNANQDMSSQMMFWVSDSVLYKQGGENLKTAITNMVNGINWAEYGVQDLEGIKELIQKNVLTPISIIINNPEQKKQFTDSLNNLLDIDYSSMPVEKAKSSIIQYLTVLMDLFNSYLPDTDKKNLEDMQKLFGFDNYQQNKGYKDILLPDNVEEAPVSFAKAWKELKSATDDSLKNITSGLLNMANAGTLTPDTLNSVKGYNILLDKTRLSAEKIVEEIYKLRDVDFTSMLASMHGGISSISNILATKKNNLDNKETSGNGIGADILSGMPEGIKKCSKEYQHFVNILGNGSSQMDECQKAANKLAAAYLDSNYFLEKLDNSNKDATISMLEEMGITNAEAIVMQMLTEKKEAYALKTQIAADETINFSNTTWAAISSTNAYQIASEQAQAALYRLYLQEYVLNNSKLSLRDKAKALKDYALSMGETALVAEASAYALEKSELEITNKNGKKKKKKNNKYFSNFTDYMEKHLPHFKKIIPDISAGNAGSTGSGNTSGNIPKTPSSKSTKAKESKTEIDWLARAIDSIINKTDLLAAKLENLFTNKRISKNLKKQIKEASKEIKKARSNAEKYKNKANKTSLPANLKRKARSGKITGSHRELVKVYGKKTAGKIGKYIKYYSKYQKAIKSAKKAAVKKKNLEQDLEDNTTLSKRNANINQQIRLTKKLQDAYAKAEKNYKNKADSIKLDKELKKLARNGKIKGSYKELIKKYGSGTAQKIEEYQKYYDKSKDAQKSRIEAKTSERELRKSKHQNIADDAEARINKLNAQAASQITVEKKNLYLKQSAKWIKESYNAQIKIAKLEKDSVKAAQLKAEKKKALNDLEIQTFQNLQDEYDSYVSLYSAEAGNARNAKEKEASIKKQAAYLKKSYSQQIKIANAEGNTALKKQLQIDKAKELLELNSQIYQNYADEYNASAGLANAQAVNALSAKEKNKYEQKSLEYTIQEYKYLYQAAKLKNDTIEMARLEAEIRKTANDSAKTQFDNISEEYGHKLDEIDRTSSFINNQVSLTESRNGFITASLYEKLVKSEEEHLNMLLLEKAALEENFKNVETGSSQWFEMRDIIWSVDEAIQSSNASITENKQKTMESRRELAELGRSVIDNINSEADFYEKILSYRNMFDNDTGTITNAGTTTLALHAGKISNKIAQKDLIQKQIEQLDKDFVSGNNNISFKDYYETRKGLIEQQQDYITGCYEEAEAIKELCEDGYGRQKDAMENLIDKYKQTLQSEKNLRDYEERASKQTANIASIKKQIEALKGNTTEEARAKMQKLAVQLNEAEKDLEDTEYDKYISDQEEILDNLLEEFENFTSRQLADMEGLIGKVINAMPSSSSIVNNTLNEIAGIWGIELSNALNASTLTGDYSTIADQSSATASIAQNIYDAVTGNYAGLSDNLLSVSSILQEMYNWLASNNFTTDIVDAINNINIYNPGNYTDTSTNIPNINDPDTEHIWDNNNDVNTELLNTITKMINTIGQDIYGQDKAGNSWSSRISSDGLSQMLYENTGRILDDDRILGLAQLLGINTNGLTSSQIVTDLKGLGYNSGQYGELRNTIATELSNQLGWTEHLTSINNNAGGSSTMGNETKEQIDNAGILYKVSNYISTSARKPQGSEQMALPSDPLNSYIYSRINKILDTEHSKNLAEMLGVNTQDSISTWKKNAAASLKNIGYSQGGIAETLKKIPGENGDDGWCVVQRGEGILNLEQTKQFGELVNNLPGLNNYTAMLPGLYNSAYNTTARNDSNVNVGDIVFNIDGSNVTDVDSFIRTMQQSIKGRDFMTDVVLSKISKGNSFAFMKY